MSAEYRIEDDATGKRLIVPVGALGRGMAWWLSVGTKQRDVRRDDGPVVCTHAMFDSGERCAWCGRTA